MFLRKTFGPKKSDHGNWNRPQNTELCDIFHLCNIVRVITFGRFMWAGQEVRMEGMEIIIIHYIQNAKQI